MSFLTANPTENNHHKSRDEEMRTLFHSLNHDILRQQIYDPPTPPLTPESPLHTSTNHLPSLRSPTSSEPTSTFMPRYTRSQSYTVDAHPRYTHTSQHTSCKCCPRPYTNAHQPRDYYRRPSTHLYPSSYKHHYTPSTTDIAPSHPAFSPTTTATNLKRRFEDEDCFPPAKKMKLINEDGDNGKDNPQKHNRNEKGQLSNTRKIACQVQGLLSLPGAREPKFDISQSELQRRVNEPECLTKVDMISYVRLAKNTARNLLDHNGIRTNQHNKRSAHTVLSRMCESECQVLAHGINDINMKYFPRHWFAKKSVQEILLAEESLENPLSPRQRQMLLRERIEQTKNARWMFLDFIKGLERRAQDDEMKTFNLMSHTFGVSNLINHNLFMFHLMEEELKVLQSYL